MKDNVHILITCDVDPTPEASIGEKTRAVKKSAELFAQYGIHATYFWVAKVISEYGSLPGMLAEQGHEIGCHGLTHEEEEEFSIMPESKQRNILREATSLLEQAGVAPVHSFRGPRVKISHITHKVLAELGYTADSSVCSQRIDFVSSNLINPQWITAPRLPYHPSRKSAFRRGDVPLTEVPVSAAVLPFVSGSLYTFGLSWMKFFFSMLYRESCVTGKPIVYLLHPAEFASKDLGKRRDYRIRVEGFSFRRSALLFEPDVEKRYDLNDKLFSFIAGHKNVTFLTMKEFTDTYEHQRFKQSRKVAQQHVKDQPS